MDEFNALETPRLRLRRFSPEDVTAFLAYRNDPVVARYQTWETTDASEAVELIQEQSQLRPGIPGTWFQFAVTLRPDFELIGDCGLYIDPADARLAELGFTFASAHQGQGLASEAVRAVLRFSFRALGLHRVKAVVDRRNDPAVRLLERVGMRQEALFLQHLWFKGAWCDEYVFAMLAAEWPNEALDQS
jgi:RimJ/RimL family protein N-acetyltransferase